MKQSSLEKQCSEVLTKLGVSYVEQYRIPKVKKRSYDFYFTLYGLHFLIELDGQQHFKDIPHFKTTALDQHINDCMKQFVAVALGYKIIRIHHKDNIQAEIINGINHLLHYCYPNPDWHAVYYSNGKEYNWMRGIYVTHILTLKGTPKINLMKRYIKKKEYPEFVKLVSNADLFKAIERSLHTTA